MSVEVTVAPLSVDPNTVTDRNVEEAAEIVLFPDVHSRGALRVNGKVVKLRPLPVKHGRALNMYTKRLMDMGDLTATEGVDATIEVFLEASSYLLMYYGFHEMDVNWVNEHLSEMEVRRIVEAQMEVENAEAFLPTLLRLFIDNVKSRTKEILTPPSPPPPSSEATVPPGESPSMSS